MKRLIAVCVGLAWVGVAQAGDPTTSRPRVVPAATLRQVGATDVNQPLAAAVASVPLPGGAAQPAAVSAPPAVVYPAASGPACNSAGCPGGCAADGRTCLEKFSDWLFFHPGPRVLPTCTPIPYRAPLRQFFPCRPGDCLAVGGCNPAAGCGGCDGPAGPVVGRWGLFDRAVPQAVPVAPGQTAAIPARATVRDRLKGALAGAGYGFHHTSWSDLSPYIAFPTPEGYRYAAPTIQQTGPAPAQLWNGPAVTPQQTANRPLTYQ
jgi:hypothetical protein